MSSAAATIASNAARRVVKGSKSWPHKSPAFTVSLMKMIPFAQADFIEMALYLIRLFVCLFASS